jgi:hypothetical protein
VEHAKQRGASERHACQLVHQPRGTQRYRPTQRNDEDALTRAIGWLEKHSPQNCSGFGLEEFMLTHASGAEPGCKLAGSVTVLMQVTLSRIFHPINPDSSRISLLKRPSIEGRRKGSPLPCHQETSLKALACTGADFSVLWCCPYVIAPIVN